MLPAPAVESIKCGRGRGRGSRIARRGCRNPAGGVETGHGSRRGFTVLGQDCVRAGRAYEAASTKIETKQPGAKLGRDSTNAAAAPPVGLQCCESGLLIPGDCETDG